MVVVKEPVLDRRAQGRAMIGRMLEERRQMLVLFCRVAGLEPFTGGGDARRTLQEFCQVLIDYISAAHFSLYERIINGSERRQAVLALAGELYGQIESCTETAIVFNDKYDCADHCEQIDRLAGDLSVLGEALARRIELEDRLIATMLTIRA
ncbi:MAG: Rsd/AlgQ family anti-sigma factor [Gammaproteobacteria bacterium]|nr:Rsd/AlgQ family anti-sigma factor [Gammaproteobacteria bacterium]